MDFMWVAESLLFPVAPTLLLNSVQVAWWIQELLEKKGERRNGTDTPYVTPACFLKQTTLRAVLEAHFNLKKQPNLLILSVRKTNFFPPEV